MQRQPRTCARIPLHVLRYRVQQHGRHPLGRASAGSVPHRAGFPPLMLALDIPPGSASSLSPYARRQIVQFDYPNSVAQWRVPRPLPFDQGKLAWLEGKVCAMRSPLRGRTALRLAVSDGSHRRRRPQASQALATLIPEDHFPEVPCEPHLLLSAPSLSPNPQPNQVLDRLVKFLDRPCKYPFKA
jgi:hypothetical protein